MTNVFAVVGEHRWEPERLLLLGEDGRYYAYRANGTPVEVEPNAAWQLDEEALAAAVRSISVPPRSHRQQSAVRERNGPEERRGRRRSAARLGSRGSA